MLAHAGAATGRGRAFSVHKALDQVGSFLGPLLVSAAITLGWGYRGGFAVLAVPGLLAAGALFTLHRFVPRPASYDETPDPVQQVALRASLTPAFWHYAIFTALMMIGFATFGVLGYHLEARDVVPPAVVPLVYAVAMAAGALGALGSGWVYDRVGLAGLAWLPLAAAAVPWLSFATSPVLVWVGAAVWGATLGVQDSTMRAAVADMVPAARRGTAYGVFAACYGLAWLGGGTLVGALYEQGVGVVGGVVGLIELVALVWFLARVLPAARAARAVS
jgi:MFS family permease